MRRCRRGYPHAVEHTDAVTHRRRFRDSCGDRYRDADIDAHRDRDHGGNRNADEHGDPGPHGDGGRANELCGELAQRRDLRQLGSPLPVASVPHAKRDERQRVYLVPQVPRRRARYVRGKRDGDGWQLDHAEWDEDRSVWRPRRQRASKPSVQLDAAGAAEPELRTVGGALG
jgi:hypothetical protein